MTTSITWWGGTAISYIKIYDNIKTSKYKFKCRALFKKNLSKLPYNVLLDYSNIGLISVKLTWHIEQASQCLSTRLSFWYQGKGLLLSLVVEIPRTWRLCNVNVNCPACTMSKHCLQHITWKSTQTWLKIPVLCKINQYFHDAWNVAVCATVVKSLGLPLLFNEIYMHLSE